MKTSRIETNLRVPLVGAAGPVFVPGQLVHCRILRRLKPGRFRVATRGVVLEADSDLPLEPGEQLEAEVELEGDRFILRLRDYSGSFYESWGGAKGQAEIQRVLAWLGIPVTASDIMEFSERLARYRAGGPSAELQALDIWILAILWSRGIRGGRAAFATLGDYWRQQIQHVSVQPPTAAQIESFLISKISELQTYAYEETPANDARPAQVTPNEKDLRRSAFALLNKNSPQCGLYGETKDGDFGRWAHLERHNVAGGIECRWTHHPMDPAFVIAVQFRPDNLRLLITVDESVLHPELTQESCWKQAWEGVTKATSIQRGEWELNRISEPLMLRGLFWHVWDKDRLCDLTI